MAKPVNKFALALWIAAAAILVLELPITFQINDAANAIRGSQGETAGYFYGLASTWASIRTAAIGAAQLVGIGAVIELLDRMRWDGASKRLTNSN